MITFRSSVVIESPPATVFNILANKHRIPQAADSPVAVLDKTTPGPVAVGTRYREVVRVLPFLSGEVISELTVYDPPQTLAENFWGMGMNGRLRYEMARVDEGTVLTQDEWLTYGGLLRLVEPLFSRMLLPRLEARLQGVKRAIEQGVTLRNGD